MHFTVPEIGQGLFALAVLAALSIVLFSTGIFAVLIARALRRQLRRSLRMMAAEPRPIEPHGQSATA